MEAVILVGGQGTRLRPLTLTTPKPMLELAGVPFLTHQLTRVRDAGVDHVVLATSYRPQVFAAHFGDGGSFGLAIDYVTESEPLGTGGGIRNVAACLQSGPDDPVLILNGDVLSGHDIAGQLAMHRRAGAAATLHLVTVADPRAFGCVPTDGSDRVTAFLEKTPNPVTDQINAGCYVFARRCIDAIPAGRPVSVERETFPGMLESGEIVMGYVESAYWLDVGTPAAFVRGSADLVLRDGGESLLLAGAVVDDGARVDGGSVLGRRSRVAAGATVTGSVVFDDATIASGAVVRRSVVGAGAAIGAGSTLEDAVVGNGARIGAQVELLSGARVWPEVVLSDLAVRFSSDV